MAATLLHASLPMPKDFSIKTEKLPPCSAPAEIPPLISISEGRILRTQKNQGIDFNMLSSCFTLTAQFSDETLVGAHFAHFGKEMGGKDPKELLMIFNKVLDVAREKVNPLIRLQIIGHLHFWSPSLIGLSERCDCSLSEERAQETLARFLQVPSDKIKVIDTSLKTSVYLSIQADGMPIFRPPKNNKDST